jgi:PEP-CTERM motif
MRKHFVTTLFAVVLSGLLVATSEATTINFEGMAASTNTSGAPNNPASVISTGLNAQGIVFGLAGVSTGVAVISNTSGSFSDPNAVSGLDANGELTAFLSGNTYFGFVLSGTLTPAVTNSVSFRVGDDGGDIDSWTINAYGVGNVLINTQSLSGSAHQLYSLSLAGISRIEIINTTGSNAGYAVDDITFNEPTATSAAVPEPASLLLLASGMAVVAHRLRRART